MSESGVRRLAIERYAAGELTGADAKELEEHLRACPVCGEYLARVTSEKAEFLRTHPFAEFRAAAARRATIAPWYKRYLEAALLPSFRPALVPLCALVLIGALALPFAIKMGMFDSRDQRENRIKGFPSSLSYIYKRDGVVRESAPSDLFRAGDRIMIYYSSSREQYLTLVSVDHGGTVSFYHPDARSGACSIRSGTGSRLSYPVSIELDSAGGPELVVGLFSEAPFDTAGIQRWMATFERIKGDMNALEREVHSNPPAPGSSVKTLLLKRS